MRVRRGFTLFDLLIVTAIVMVLVAILVPSYARARDSARRAICLSNLRQLNQSFLQYAYDHQGHMIPANTNSDSAGTGTFWASYMISYSSAVDTRAVQKLLLNTLCPSATTLSNGVGTAQTAWGPTSQPVPYSPLVVGNQYGSYGLNGWLYSNNPPPPMVFTLTGPVGLIAKSISTSGNHSVIGDAIVISNVTLQGNAQITGALTLGGVLSANKQPGSVTYADPSGLKMPDVIGIYNALAATNGMTTLPGVPKNATFDFSKVNVLMIAGDADFSNVKNVTGAGTVLVSGDVTQLPSSLLPFNIVAMGSVNLKNGSLKGSIYCAGDVDGNGNGQINGTLVTLGNYGGNGGPDIVAGNFPSFDTTYYRPGFSKTINGQVANAAQVPTFADCVWAEAWPAVGDPLPSASDVQKGNGRYLDSNLGRFYIKRHNYGINVGFLDGHAESVSLPAVPTLKWSNQF